MPTPTTERPAGHGQVLVDSLGQRITRGVTRGARRFLVGPSQRWRFEPPPPEWTPPRLVRTSLYLHVPFCRHFCPYCPYTKTPYRQRLLAPYTAAALAEIDWWAEQVGPAEISTAYIGGGTPTLAMDSVASILEHARKRFHLRGDICIETNPADVDAGLVAQMHEAGIALVSLGVQSFQADKLAAIGRGYQPETAARSLDLLTSAGFASVNADLMFALPGQSLADVLFDLARAAQLGANQITTYPLFTFPYTPVGNHLRLKGVRMPRLNVRRRQYKAISQWCEDHDFQRVSVWGFKRGSVPRYSSVTRAGYIGIGPGSGSQLPDGFVLNTFDLEAWMQTAGAGRSAIALRMPFSAQMSGWWWLYWRFYETRIPLDAIDAELGTDAAKARLLLWAAQKAGMATTAGRFLELTPAGAFWLHLAQNYFALNYVNTLWTQARRQPWPQSIAL